MNVLFVGVDSLTRYFLDVYDGDPGFDVETPNIDRFAERAAVFDSHYAGSLPCMPARREWLTGTQEFLWRPWGPVEPFDTTLPAAAREADVLSELVTDHYHYFQHGSHGYYEDFNGFEFVRGHEVDAWQTSPYDPDERLLRQTAGDDADPHDVGYTRHEQYARNVADFDELDERDFFAPKVFSKTAEWVRENDAWENWLCFVDSFDVHEPFHCPEPYASMYTDEDPTDPELTVWPFYGRVDEGQSTLSDRQLEFVRAQFAGKVTMVDRWLGRVFDALDRGDRWGETMVVLTADHGHFLGEHGWVGKPYGAPQYDVLAKTPLLVWHPDSPKNGERVDALTSAVDLYATVLDAYDAPVPDETHSRSLFPLLMGETDEHRDWALYGYWGSTVNVTDGEYTYMRPCEADVDAECHSTEMMNPYGWFKPPEPQDDAESGRFLPHTESPVWRYAAPSNQRHGAPKLFETASDPRQRNDLVGDAPDEHERMRDLLGTALDELDAPDSQYERLGLAQ